MSRTFRFVARAIALLALIAIAVAAGLIVWVMRPLPLPASPFVFDVKSGASLRAVARELAAANVLPTEDALVALARLKRADRAIKAGNYEIAAGITLPQLLDKLTQGDVTQTGLTIVEGSTFAELRRRCPTATGRGARLRPTSSRAGSACPDRASKDGSFPDTYCDVPPDPHCWRARTA
jgi:UPF0755 protein